MRHSWAWLLCGVLGAQELAFRVEEGPRRSSDSGFVEAMAQFRSRDGGRIVVSRTTAPDLPLADPFQAVHSGSSVAYSEDGGRSFQPIEVPGIPEVSSVAFGRQRVGLRYVLGRTGSFAVTQDDGLSWQTFLGAAGLVLSTLNGPNQRLELDPRDDRFVYRTRSGYSEFFINGMGLWNQERGFFEDVPGLPSSALGPFRRPGAVELFAASETTIWRSNRAGGAWTEVARLPAGSPIRDLAFDAVATRRIWALRQDGSFWRSQDDGSTWQQIPVPDGSRQIAVNPFRSGHVILVNSRSWSISIDGGNTFVVSDFPVPPVELSVGLFDSSPIEQIEFDARDTNVVYAEGRKRISRNAGINWGTQNPGRVGVRACSPLDAAKCYAIGERYSNFFIEKYGANGDLEWSSYWGGQDGEGASSVAVDENGLLWLNTRSQLARVSAEGRLIDTRNLGAMVRRIVPTSGGAFIGSIQRASTANFIGFPPGGNVVSESLAVFDPVTLGPIARRQIDVNFLTSFVVRNELVFFVAGGRLYEWNSGGSTFVPREVAAGFSPNGLAWSPRGNLVVAGSGGAGGPRRGQRAEVWERIGGDFSLIAALDGSNQDSAREVHFDEQQRMWVLGFSGSEDFPTRAPLWSGMERGSDSAFLALFPPGRSEATFSSFIPVYSSALPAASGIDLIGASMVISPGRLILSPLPGFLLGSLGSGNAWQLYRIRPDESVTFPVHRTSRTLTGRNWSWSRGSWMRLESEGLKGLAPLPFSLTRVSENSFSGYQVLLDGAALPILSAGDGYLDVALSGLRNEEDKGRVQLVKDGLRSQMIRLRQNAAAFDLLFHPNEAARLLAYNADGSENSQENPARLGSQILLFSVGGEGLDSLVLYAQPLDNGLGSLWGARTDYVSELPGGAPGIRYAAITLPTGTLEGLTQLEIFRNFEEEAAGYVWVKP